MNRGIYKYPWPLSQHVLGPEELHTPRLPLGSRVVAFQLQEGVPTMWIDHDLDEPCVAYTFQLFGTGHAIPAVGEYQGTIQMFDGKLVLHLYLLGVGMP